MIQSEAALARPLLQPQGLSFTLLAGAGPSLAPCFFLKGLLVLMMAPACPLCSAAESW